MDLPPTLPDNLEMSIDRSMQSGPSSNDSTQKYILFKVTEKSSGSKESDSVLAIQKLIQEQKGTVIFCSAPASQNTQATVENGTSKKSKVPDGYVNQQSAFELVSDTSASQIIKRVIGLNWVKQTEVIGVEDGFGRVLASSVSAKIDIPDCDEALYCGFAVRCADGEADRLVVRGMVEPSFDVKDVPALKEFECVKVTRGAPIPPGADAVMKEFDGVRLSLKSDERSYHSKRRFFSTPTQGAGIRLRGSEAEVDDLVCCSEEELTAITLGKIVSVGVSEITVFKKPVIALVSVGNRLVESARIKTENGRKVYNSTGMIVKSMLSRKGFGVINLGTVANDPSSLMEKFSLALSKADVIITTSDILDGETNYIKPVLKTDFGATIHFGVVKMDPWNKFTFATVQWEGKTKFVFLLPSKMPAAVISTVVYIIPALKQMEGVYFNEIETKMVQVKFDAKWETAGLKTVPQYFWNFTRENQGTVSILKDGQHSNVYDCCQFQSDAVLVRIPSKLESDVPDFDREFCVPGIELKDFF